MIQKSELNRQVGEETAVVKQELVSEDAQQMRMKDATGRPWAIAFISFCFILLQSACSAFMAISGLRLLIGVGSLAAASTGLKLLDAIHSEAIRIPMTILAVVGSVVNLYAVWRVRSLRARPSSQWRMSPVDPAKKRSESMQIAIALITLALVAVESAAHIHLLGGLFH